ncbi:MAG: CHASE domain-containing protein [Candidatus Nitrosotenuis sp.]
MNRHVPWLGLGVSLAVTVLATILVYNLISQITQERFGAEVHETKSAIESRLKAYEQVLSGAKGLFVAAEAVTREEWKNFVDAQAVEERFPGIQGIGYSKLVGGKEDLAAHIEEIRKEGFPDYTVWPQGEREEYHSIIYLEPFNERNKRAFGYDMYSEPTRREAMVLARDAGTTTLSGKVKLVQETEVDVQAGFLMYVPIYENGKPTGTIDERREAFTGFVYAPFRMNDFMEGILGKTSQDITFVICDTNTDPQNIMYDYTAVKGIKNDQIDTSYSTTVTVDANQRQWILKITALKSLRSDLEAIIPSLVALAGVSFSVLLFFIFRTYTRVITLTQQTAKSEKLVAIGELASRLAHDLRNPITTIKASADLLQQSLKGTQNDKATKHIGQINRAAERMLGQLDSVVDFVRSKPLQFSKNSVVGLISEATKTTPIPENIKISLPNNDVQIECDSKQLVVAFSNLVTNAVEAMGDNGTITFAVTTKGDAVVIEVSDSGPSIPKEHLSKIFEPLFTTKPTGTGLGLVSCKNIVEQHHGKISAKNNPTTFMVELPIKQ